MSLTQKILEGKIGEIERELFALAKFAVTESKDVIMEMRDAPDNSAYPLTRREVEKMLTKYERREDDSTGLDNPEARSIEGMQKSRWYAPEHSSDFVDEFIDGATGVKRNTDDRPAKIMPYDYKFTVHKPGDINVSQASEVGDADTTNDQEDWEGGFNRYFAESAEDAINDASEEDIVNLFHDSAKGQYPVELHLDDGSYVTVEPHHAQHFINAGKADDIPNYMKSASHFKVLLQQVYANQGATNDDSAGQQ
jgi:hypothetical protein